MIRENPTAQKDGYKRPSLRTSFLRAQIVSLTATTTDFFVSIGLYQVFDIYYVTSTILGALSGACTSFTLGRNWAFINRQGKISRQALKFILTNGFSLFANTTGVYFFKENFDLSFVASRVIVAVFVGVSFNFLLNRYFVFR